MSFNKSMLVNLKDNWVKFDLMIFHIEASMASIAVYGYLASVPEDFHPSEMNIAEALDISPNTVVRALRELVKAGVLTQGKQKIGGGRKQRNVYAFVPRKLWKAKIAPSFYAQEPASEPKK